LREARRDRRGAQPIEVRHAAGSHRLARADDRRERPELTLAAGAGGPGGGPGLRALIALEAHDHVVGLAAELEARHVDAAEQRLEGRRDLPDRDAEIARAVPVDHDLELRLVDDEVALEVHDARHAAAPLYDLVRVARELGRVRTLDDQGDRI